VAVTSVKFGDTSVAPSTVSDTGLLVGVPEIALEPGRTSKAISVSVVNAVGSESNQIPFTFTTPHN
jgi:hypothetical protein